MQSEVVTEVFVGDLILEHVAKPAFNAVDWVNYTPGKAEAPAPGLQPNIEDVWANFKPGIAIAPPRPPPPTLVTEAAGFTTVADDEGSAVVLFFA